MTATETRVLKNPAILPNPKPGSKSSRNPSFGLVFFFSAAFCTFLQQIM